MEIHEPLEDEQVIQQLEELGFCVVPGLLPQEEVSQLLKSTQDKIPDEKSEFATLKDKKCTLNHLREPDNARIIQSILNLNLISKLTSHYHSNSFVEHTKVLIKSAGSPATSWHQDASFWTSFDPEDTMITLWIPLVNVSINNGCLKVLKGSHTTDLIEHEPLFGGKELAISDERINQLQEQYPLMDVEMNPGDGLIFKSRLLHGAHQNNTTDHRLAFKIVFQDLSKRNTKVERNMSSIRMDGLEGFLNKKFNLMATRRKIK